MKILTDLNARKGVTCVMVTHDVALKAFAHRVIRMVDGKISRIEETPDFVRQDALDTLAASAPVQAIMALERSAAAAAAASGTQATSSGSGVGRPAAAAGIVTGGRSWSRLDEDGTESVGQGGGGVLGSLAWAASQAALAARGLLAFAGVLEPPAPPAVDSAGDRALPPPSSVRVVGTTTSMGLSGVAAISHAVFAGRSLGMGGGGPAAPTASPHTSAHRVVRTPESYATYTFGVRARAAAAEEEAARVLAAAAKEARLRAALAAQQELRAAAAAARGAPMAVAW